jgi:hypothetical protein
MPAYPDIPDTPGLPMTFMPPIGAPFPHPVAADPDMLTCRSRRPFINDFGRPFSYHYPRRAGADKAKTDNN